MTSRTKQCLGWAARLVLAAVFVIAAVPKLADPTSFAVAVQKYRMFPDEFVGLIAVIVPMLELVGAVALLSPWRRGGALLLGVLLLGFTTALTVAMGWGLDVDCGCFGGSGDAEAIGPLHLLRNLGLLALVGAVLAQPRVR